MNRSNYDDGCDGWDLIRWRGAVAAATKGARGQKLLRELADALDAMPVRRLIAESLEAGPEVCALGCLGRAKGIDMSRLDPEEPEKVAKAFGVAPALVREIAFVNDDWQRHQTAEQRWAKMRAWVSENLKANA